MFELGSFWMLRSHIFFHTGYILHSCRRYIDRNVIGGSVRFRRYIVCNELRMSAMRKRYK